MTGTADTPLPERANTVAVVTTYHPEPGLRARLGAVHGEVSGIVIVDNGSEPAERLEIEELATTPNVTVLSNPDNVGLAAALNQGMALAIERRAAWALLLDQDSRCEAGIVAEAARVANAARGAPVAAIGAGMVGKDAGSARGADWREERALITSGTMVSTMAWRDVGGFREDFFVDYVDLEFCLRARAAGYRVLRSLRPTIHHAIGTPVQRWFLWRPVTLTNHDRGRRHAITRNRVALWRARWRTERQFVASDVAGFMKELVKIVIFESDRRGKLHAVARGVREGAQVDVG